MRDDYKKQLNDYKNDYTDDDINDRLETIKNIRTQHYNEIEKMLGIEIPDQIRDSINGIIGKTIQQQKYQHQHNIRTLENTYQKVSKKFPDLFDELDT